MESIEYRLGYRQAQIDIAQRCLAEGGLYLGSDAVKSLRAVLALPPVPPRPRREDFHGYADDDAGPERDEDIDNNDGELSVEDQRLQEGLANTNSDLPPHVMEREPPEDDGYDADTGEVAEDDPGERDPFWSGEHLVVVFHRTNNRADWDGAKTALLSRIAEARSVAELSRLEADNKSTINRVSLALKSTVVATAIKTRMAELRRIDTAGNPLSALDAG